VLVERWSLVEPWTERRLGVALAAAAVAGTFAIVFAALVGAGAVVLRRARLDGLAGRIGRVAVPAALLVVTVVSAWELVSESLRIVD
jgi:hypothetical protein